MENDGLDMESVIARLKAIQEKWNALLEQGRAAEVVYLDENKKVETSSIIIDRSNLYKLITGTGLKGRLGITINALGVEEIVNALGLLSEQYIGYLYGNDEQRSEAWRNMTPEQICDQLLTDDIITNQIMPIVNSIYKQAHKDDRSGAEKRDVSKDDEIIRIVKKLMVSDIKSIQNSQQYYKMLGEMFGTIDRYDGDGSKVGKIFMMYLPEEIRYNYGKDENGNPVSITEMKENAVEELFSMIFDNPKIVEMCKKIVMQMTDRSNTALLDPNMTEKKWREIVTDEIKRLSGEMEIGNGELTSEEMRMAIDCLKQFSNGYRSARELPPLTQVADNKSRGPRATLERLRKRLGLGQKEGKMPMTPGLPAAPEDPDQDGPEI